MVIKPLVLQGHSKPVTRVRVNRDGDLLFTSAKNSSPCVWFVENGERVGTYEGHQVRAVFLSQRRRQGAVSDLDVSWDSRVLITAGGGDETVRIWDVETGQTRGCHRAASNVRALSFAYSNNVFCYTNMQRTAAQRSVEAFVAVVDLRIPEQVSGDNKSSSRGFHSFLNVLINSALSPFVMQFPLEKTANSVVFSHLDDMITVGCSTGNLFLFDLVSGSNEPKNFYSGPSTKTSDVRDLQLSADRLCLISASQDRTARLFEARSLEPLKKVGWWAGCVASVLCAPILNRSVDTTIAV